jgi:hypothetical protein
MTYAAPLTHRLVLKGGDSLAIEDVRKNNTLNNYLALDYYGPMNQIGPIGGYEKLLIIVCIFCFFAGMISFNTMTFFWTEPLYECKYFFCDNFSMD